VLLRAGAAVGPVPGWPGDTVCVGAFDGHCHGLDAATGEPRFVVGGAGASQARPLLVDADGDGGAELVVGCQAGLACLVPRDWPPGEVLRRDGPATATGLRWRVGGATVSTDPCVDDLDGDGRPEVLAGDTTGRVWCVDLRTGEVAWDWRAAEPGEHLLEGAFAVADLDGDGVRDVAVPSHDRTVTVLTGRGRMRGATAAGR
jgi:outer membrane protein assembly factor BamB